MKALLSLSLLALVAVLVKAQAITSPRPSPRRGDAPISSATTAAVPTTTSSQASPAGTSAAPSEAPQEAQGPAAPPSVPELLGRPLDLATVEALSDAYPRLEKSHDPLADRVEASLVVALADPSEDVRAAAVEGLGASPDRNGDRLQALYGSESSAGVRAEVVKALSRSRDFLRRVLTSDASTDVRRFAAESARLHLAKRDCEWLARAKDSEAEPTVRQALDDSIRVLSGAK